MPKAMPPLCHCGRPLGHTGRHVGYRAPDGAPPAAKRPKIAAVVEAQIKLCHDRIARLKADIRDLQAELRRAESELGPLNALNDVYSDLRLPAPEPVPVPVLFRETATVIDVGVIADAFADYQVGKPPAATSNTALVLARADRGPRDKAEATPEDFEPLQVDLSAVSQWAGERGLSCKTWDDLPAINRKREQLGLRTFKRKLAHA